MLIGRDWLRSRVDLDAQQALYDAVNDLCQTIEADSATAILSRELGARVWLLPSRVYAYQCAGHSLRLSLARFTADTIGRPAMRRVCSIPGACGIQSNIRWSLGKGFIAQVLTVEDIAYQDNDSELLNWKRRAPDVKKLRELYRSAIGTSLGTEHAKRGVLTIQVPRHRAGAQLASLSTGEMEACGVHMLRAAPLISNLCEPWF